MSLIYEFEPSKLQRMVEKTPFFLFSKKQILKNIDEFNKNFPGSVVSYAMKANSELPILRLIAKAGLSFEVASSYELNLLKKIKVSPQNIVYGSSVKPADSIKEFFDYGVRTFAFDSSMELEKIAFNAPGSNVYVRVCVNDTGSVFRFSEKFGTDVGNVVSLLQKAKSLGLVPYGISFHVGSQASNVLAWANAIAGLRDTIKELSSLGIDIQILNIGGGYPCKYSSSEEMPELKEISENVFKEYNKLDLKPKIMMEPGRAMVADAGVAVATVISKVDRNGISWLFLDLGVYNGLFESMAYQGSTRYSVTSLNKIGNNGEHMFALAGPTGDSADIITREALLPSDIDVGDKIIFHSVGAYSLVVTSLFNGFPKPSVYIV